MAVIDQLRRLYDINWASSGSRRQGLDLAAEIVAEDFEFHFAPEVSDRTLHGLADIGNFMMAVEEDFREYRQRIHNAFGDEDRVVIIGETEARGRLSGLLTRTPFAHVWTLQYGVAVSLQGYMSIEQPRRATHVDGEQA